MNINNTSGLWTIKPNGSELINGKPSLTVGIGEEIEIYCDGTAFYTSASRGHLVELWKQTASSSGSIDFDFASGWPADFDEFEIHLVKVNPATDDDRFEVRVKTTASLTVQTSGYAYGGRIQGVGAGADMGSNTDGLVSSIPLSRTGSGQGVGSASGEFISGKLSFDTPNAGDYPIFEFNGSYVRSDETPIKTTVTGFYGSTVAVTGVRLLFNAGNIASGTFVLYGVRK